jgi:hypothetical protein
VAAPPALQRKRSLVETGPAYQVEPPSQVTRPREDAKKVLTEASQRLREKQQQLPRPPRRTFGSGIVTFPFYRDVLVRCLALTLAVLVVWVLVESVKTATPFMIPIICAMAAVTGLGVLALSSVFLLSILAETAHGADRVDFVFEFSPIDWLLQSLFLVNSFSICVIPGLVAARFLSAPDQWAWYVAPGLFFLFPVLLLSMLESNSCVAPYSWTVWRSLRTSKGPWCVVYGETVLLAAAVALAVWATAVQESVWARTVLVFVCVCAATANRAARGNQVNRNRMFPSHLHHRWA